MRSELRRIFREGIELKNTRSLASAFGAASHGGWKDDDRAAWLCDQLRDCPHVLEGDYCAVLSLPQGSTYGEAARSVRMSL
jgi:hypothetical protein